jgi:hypothetical protein
MSETFVLVNGAWHGGWAWRPVATHGWAPRFPQRLGVEAITGPGSHEACFTRPADLAASFLAA